MDNRGNNERVLKEIHEMISFSWKCMKEIGAYASAKQMDELSAKWGNYLFDKFPDMWDFDSLDADLVQLGHDIHFAMVRFYNVRRNRE